ncbi:MAG: YihY/virulence factor BrkB family protein [Acidobacteria bacterium]|nr:MAG: YihY/virulence factor BrkB family protein [Acidobacteriota bacterium]
MFRRLYAALAPTFRYWSQTEVHVYAFSVAANVLLAFFPFLIVMMSLSRVFFSQPTTLAAIDLALRDYFPDALGNFLQRNLPQRGRIEIVSLILLLFTANGIFQPLEVALNHVWGIRKNRNFFHNQLVSLGLILVCGALALVSLMFTALNYAWLKEVIGAAALLPLFFLKLAAVPLAALVLFLIYFYLPNGRPPLARVVAAAIGVGLLMEVLKYLTRLIWPWFFTKLTREYGVFKYSVTLILIGFLASMLVLAGAEWAARGHRMDNPR